MPRRLPGAQRGRGVGVEVRAVVAAGVAVFPQQALQRLQRGVLAVGVDPALQHLDDHRVAAQAAILERHLIEPAAHVGLVATRRDKGGQGTPRVGKQHVLDEGDAAGGAFDVGEDDRALHAACPTS
jgi:hypothetical protein